MQQGNKLRLFFQSADWLRAPVDRSMSMPLIPVRFIPDIAVGYLQQNAPTGPPWTIYNGMLCQKILLTWPLFQNLTCLPISLLDRNPIYHYFLKGLICCRLDFIKSATKISRVSNRNHFWCHAYGSVFGCPKRSTLYIEAKLIILK